MSDNSDEEYIDYMQERERWLLEENERLRAENEKLREALKQCREALEWDSTYHDGEKWLYIIDGDKANAARTIARAAAAIRESGDE